MVVNETQSAVNQPGASNAAAAAGVTAPRRQMSKRSDRASRRLKIGVIGFGNFGQFISKKFVADHDVVAMGRGDHTVAANEIGASWVCSGTELRRLR